MTTAHDNYLHHLATRNDIYEEGEYEAIISVEIPIKVYATSEDDAVARAWEALHDDHPQLSDMAAEITTLIKDGAVL